MGYGQKKKRRQREEIPEQTSSIWYLLCICVIAGAGLSVVGMILSTWRNGAAIQYRYMFRSKERTVSVSETSYGLYNIVYDGGGAYISWTQRVSDITTRGNAAIQIGQQATQSNAQFQAWATQCPAQCQDAISTRISCYKRISTISTILLGALSVGGALGLIGVGWFFMFGKLAYLQMACWFLAGAVCYGCLGYWIWETDTCWRMIVAGQQLPYPAVGMPWYLTLVSSGLYVVAGVGSFFAEMIDTYNEKKLKDQAQMRLMMEAGDAFDGFFGPGVPGMGQPGMGPPGMVGAPRPPSMMMPPAMGMMGPPGVRGPRGGSGIGPAGVGMMGMPGGPGMGPGMMPPGMRPPSPSPSFGPGPNFGPRPGFGPRPSMGGWG
ncbi:multitransmembrane protein with signal peptide and GMGPP repeat at C-terminus, related [Neospora caninum Liverpool]|uniref:Multitransmembrane protein with signal peptide and GMGPP repeat at C-terminus, related n=1 Tax=Neospora caninum (strain Liverpool) TaxID=572307 RepID=F0VBB2_NEOCL|nr:multitransmembrane protein with signal peptide and GMGPP repeat at C-terminus, related [Neospora caninum Liverpool]CBZ50896.1 multitransmembrane protein with signal peptide and GMGPP repeat at C-terminus, related [Neospora caninum Liverpool]CEL68198.1 TPA: Multitransmembrane protein with signal peptide and GMGPP repeat at C-terminus, related [Neospora caninum Liverpool]|eukprot:XP_003880929.1 multitransmembrane protein with signal peptide and GMGPP repeat at C-terminus, related [Neospora caninum Liverpool]